MLAPKVFTVSGSGLGRSRPGTASWASRMETERRTDRRRLQATENPQPATTYDDIFNLVSFKSDGLDDFYFDDPYDPEAEVSV